MQQWPLEKWDKSEALHHPGCHLFFQSCRDRWDENSKFFSALSFVGLRSHQLLQSGSTSQAPPEGFKWSFSLIQHLLTWPGICGKWGCGRQELKERLGSPWEMSPELCPPLCSATKCCWQGFVDSSLCCCRFRGTSDGFCLLLDFLEAWEGLDQDGGGS